MYKSKLQEYCHSQAWNLPVYSTTKEGFDHCPRFKASVVVNGSTFSTPSPLKSSKDAQNLAAKLAFDHFLGSSSMSPSSPSTPIQQPTSNETTSDSLGGVNSSSRNHKNSKDIGHFYKSQLQTYAQKRNLPLPSYVTEREGPPHLCSFKSKVTVDGKTYESSEYFFTIKDAENAAAKVALAATSSDGNEEEEPIFYKNLLQELAQKEFTCLPVYSTLNCGSSHLPIFVSTVEVKGELFTGQEAKTKKLAELDAAKVAYNSLKERFKKQNSISHPPGFHVEDLPLCSSSKQHLSHVGESSQQTILEPALRSCRNFAEQGRCSGGVNEKVAKSEPDVLEPELGPKFDQTPSQSIAKRDTEDPERSDTYKSPKKRKLESEDPIMAFPPGTVIMRSGEKWVAVTNLDSIQDNV